MSTRHRNAGSIRTPHDVIRRAARGLYSWCLPKRIVQSSGKHRLGDGSGVAHTLCIPCPQPEHIRGRRVQAGCKQISARSLDLEPLQRLAPRFRDFEEIFVVGGTTSTQRDWAQAHRVACTRISRFESRRRGMGALCRRARRGSHRSAPSSSPNVILCGDYKAVLRASTETAGEKGCAKAVHLHVHSVARLSCGGDR